MNNKILICYEAKQLTALQISSHSIYLISTAYRSAITFGLQLICRSSPYIDSRHPRGLTLTELTRTCTSSFTLRLIQVLHLLPVIHRLLDDRRKAVGIKIDVCQSTATRDISTIISKYKHTCTIHQYKCSLKYHMPKYMYVQATGSATPNKALTQHTVNFKFQAKPPTNSQSVHLQTKNHIKSTNTLPAVINIYNSTTTTRSVSTMQVNLR